MAEISPGRLLKGKSPRLLDEWQIAPKLWDAVRFEGDQMFAVLLKMAGRKFPEICLRIQNNMEDMPANTELYGSKIWHKDCALLLTEHCINL